MQVALKDSDWRVQWASGHDISSLSQFTAIELEDSQESLQDFLISLAQREGTEVTLRCIYDARNKLYRWGTDAAQGVTIKHFSNNGWWKRFAYRWVIGKARRSLIHSERLLASGLLCPQPLLCVERWQEDTLRESWYLSAHILYTADAWKIKSAEIADWQSAAQSLGRAIARMHNAEMMHLDLTPGNILFQKEDDLWHSIFIDVNRMRFGALSYQAAINNLVQLGFESEQRDIVLRAYAKERNTSFKEIRRAYIKKLSWHHLKWRIKDGTRPWRRKFGL